MFLQKFHVENFPQKIDKNFDVNSPSIFVLFYRVFGFGCFSAMGVQKHYKKRFTTNSTKIQNQIFSIYFITFLGVSRYEGFKKKYFVCVCVLRYPLQGGSPGAVSCKMYSVQFSPMSVSPQFLFSFIAFSVFGFLSNGSSKHHKKRFTKKNKKKRPAPTAHRSQIRLGRTAARAAKSGRSTEGLNSA
jgi:hypothetical protein